VDLSVWKEKTEDLMAGNSYNQSKTNILFNGIGVTFSFQNTKLPADYTVIAPVLVESFIVVLLVVGLWFRGRDYEGIDVAATLAA
jgi:hypothetical protein